MDLPRIAITLGDVAGIGPEVIVRAWNYASLHTICRPFVVGHPEVLRRALRLVDGGARVVEVATPEQAEPRINAIPCLPTGNDNVLQVSAGHVDARAGEAAFRYLVTAGKLALAGRVDAITTAPLSKYALHAAGHRYPGHTEVLANLARVDDFAMMLYLPRREPASAPSSVGPAVASGASGGFGVAHVTLHTALADVARLLTVENVFSKIRLVHELIERLEGRRPRVAVAALNPHAGEGGLFGDEEKRILEPAIARARQAGFDVAGPVPADTLFLRAAQGEFGAVVAMYHDQGHIAVKLLGFHRAVNVTLGLPLVRTSVAHGTAFDIAWQGKAQPDGMVEALRVAAALARRLPGDGASPSSRDDSRPESGNAVVAEG